MNIFSNFENKPAMPQLPSIYIIQASDAPQHTGKLQEILQEMQAENRIRDFKILDEKRDFSSFSDKLREEDMVILVLTHQLESDKTKIENSFKVIKEKHPDIRIVEILLDNIIYDNSFITFPMDLRPINIRDNVDTAWNDIEQNLKTMLSRVEQDSPDQKVPEWLQGDLIWPWESPGRWNGALFLGLAGSVFVVIAQFLNFSNDPRGLSLFQILGGSLLIGGVLYSIAGAVSRMRRASIFFAVAYAFAIMILWITTFGTYEDVVGAALVFGGPISAVVGSTIGRFQSPIRLSGMIFLGIWPWFFTEFEPIDAAFLLNTVVIAVLLCLLAWQKPIEPKHAVKLGAFPFALNLAGGCLIYMIVSNPVYVEGNAFFLTILTIVTAASLGLVYRINRKRFAG